MYEAPDFTKTGDYLRDLQANGTSRSSGILQQYAARLKQQQQAVGFTPAPNAKDAIIPGVSDSNSPSNSPTTSSSAGNTNQPPMTPIAPKAPSPISQAAGSFGGAGLGQLLNGAGGATGGVQTPTIISGGPAGQAFNAPAMAEVNPGWETAGAYALPVVASALTAKAGYDVSRNKDPGRLGDVALGTNPMTAAPYWTAKALGIGMGRGKDQDQRGRDEVRKFLLDNKAIDADYNVTLADGTKYNIGNDGGYRQDNGLRAFEVDTSNPLSKYAASAGGAIGDILGNGPGKISDAFGGYLANAAMSNAKSETDVYKNIAAIMHGMGMDPNTAITALKSNKNIPPQQVEARVNVLNQVAGQYNTLYGGASGAAPTGGVSFPRFSMPSVQMPKVIPAPPQGLDSGELLGRLAQAGTTATPQTDPTELFTNVARTLSQQRKQ